MAMAGDSVPTARAGAAAGTKHCAMAAAVKCSAAGVLSFCNAASSTRNPATRSVTRRWCLAMATKTVCRSSASAVQKLNTDATSADDALTGVATFGVSLLAGTSCANAERSSCTACTASTSWSTSSAPWGAVSWSWSRSWSWSWSSSPREDNPRSSLGAAGPTRSSKSLEPSGLTTSTLGATARNKNTAREATRSAVWSKDAPASRRLLNVVEMLNARWNMRNNLADGAPSGLNTGSP